MNMAQAYRKLDSLAHTVFSTLFIKNAKTDKKRLTNKNYSITILCNV